MDSLLAVSSTSFFNIKKDIKKETKLDGGCYNG